MTYRDDRTTAEKFAAFIEQAVEGGSTNPTDLVPAAVASLRLGGWKATRWGDTDLISVAGLIDLPSAIELGLFSIDADLNVTQTEADPF